MSIVKWKDLNEILSIRDKIDSLFNSLFEKTSFHSWEERFALISSGMPAPQMNVYQRGADTIIQVELPGFEKGDIKVSVSGNLLAIGSEINREREFRGNDAYRYQRSHGSFCRVMELPAGADANSIRASFNNSVLEIVIPKSQSIISAGQVPRNQLDTVDTADTGLIPSSRTVPVHSEDEVS